MSISREACMERNNRKPQSRTTEKGRYLPWQTRFLCVLTKWPRNWAYRYSPPAKAGGGSPPVGRARALSEGNCASCGSRRTMPQSGWFCCHRPRSYRKYTQFCVCEQGYSLYPCLAPTACENLPPAALSQIWVSLLRRHPFSFCEKETKTKGR